MSYIDDFLEMLGFKEPDRSGEVINQTITTTGEKIPQYLEDFSKDQLELIDRLSLADYQAPSETGVAALDPEQIAALKTAKDYYGAEGGTEAYKAASGALSNLSALSDQRMTDEGALTPFMNQFLDPMREEIDRATQISQIEAASKATGSGGYSAFGGNRRGLVEGSIAGEGIRAKAGLQAKAFDRAVENYRKDQAMRGVAAGAAMEGAGNLQSLVGKDIGGQFLTGGYQQAHDQAKIDERLTREKEKRDWAYKMADFRQGGLSGIPYGKMSTTTADTYGGAGGNTFMTGIGNLGSVASGIGNFYATPSGGGQSPATGWSNLWDKLTS